MFASATHGGYKKFAQSHSLETKAFNQMERHKRTSASAFSLEISSLPSEISYWTKTGDPNSAFPGRHHKNSAQISLGVACGCRLVQVYLANDR